jgi:hypothetical protein
MKEVYPTCAKAAVAFAQNNFAQTQTRTDPPQPVVETTTLDSVTFKGRLLPKVKAQGADAAATKTAREIRQLGFINAQAPRNELNNSDVSGETFGGQSHLDAPQRRVAHR